MTYTTEQLEKMLADATPGPWFVGGEDAHNGIRVFYVINRVPVANVPCGYTDRNGDANASMIAAAPTIATAHIAALERIAELEAALGNFDQRKIGSGVSTHMGLLHDAQVHARNLLVGGK